MGLNLGSSALFLGYFGGGGLLRRKKFTFFPFLGRLFSLVGVGGVLGHVKGFAGLGARSCLRTFGEGGPLDWRHHLGGAFQGGARSPDFINSGLPTA